MADNTYTRRDLGMLISEGVSNIIQERDLKVYDFADKLHASMGYKSRESAVNFIDHVRKGFEYPWMIRYYLPHTPITPTGEKRHNNALRKLSILLSHIRISPNDELIQQVKETYPNFAYPPDSFEGEASSLTTSLIGFTSKGGYTGIKVSEEVLRSELGLIHSKDPRSFFLLLMLVERLAYLGSKGK